MIAGGIRRSQLVFHRLTGIVRLLPDFLIIGVPRSGTTSLFNYIIEHPAVFQPLWKEVAFFSKHYDKGVTWYKSHFTSKLTKSFITSRGKDFQTGESTPNCLYHPQAPKRIFEVIPKVKMILLLRNPVDRANSHYWQSVRKTRETSSFEDVITKQMNEDPISDEKAFLPGGGDFANRYISGGIYTDRIKRFFEIFPKDQILILKSEDLYDDPKSTYKKTLEFLNLSKYEMQNFKKFNYYEDQPDMDKSIRQKLIEFYKPHNEKLYKLLDRNFNWDK